ncbi:hypothetical protein ACVMFA_009484 [Bradyrhizobium liaoningense]
MVRQKRGRLRNQTFSSVVHHPWINCEGVGIHRSLDVPKPMRLCPAQGNDRYRDEVAKAGYGADGAVGVGLVLAPDDGAWLDGVAELGLESLQEAPQAGLLHPDRLDAEIIGWHQRKSLDLDREFDVDVRQAEHRPP